MSGKYEDIINLPHYVSSRRTHMSMVERGAQFSPFAALTGFDAAIQETARLTDARTELSEGRKEEMNEKLRLIAETISRQPEVAVTYFKPDSRKAGGAYVTVTGKVKKIDPLTKMLLFLDGGAVSLEEMVELEIL